LEARDPEMIGQRGQIGRVVIAVSKAPAFSKSHRGSLELAGAVGLLWGEEGLS
jgi:hypothetical protein